MCSRHTVGQSCGLWCGGRSLRGSAVASLDVKAVLEGLLNVMPKHLRRGVKIKLNRFGTFKVIFGGNGQENAEDVTAADIDSTRISFIGASEMKKAVLTDMPFQKVV